MTLRRSSATALLLLAGLLPSGARAAPEEPTVALLLGAGNGGWRLDGHTAWFRDLLAREPLRLAAAAEGSVRILPWLHGGVRLSPLYLRAGDDGTRTSLLVARLEGVATARPPGASVGPYVRLGLGPAALRYSARVPGLASGSTSAAGGSLSLGLGGFAVVREHVELRLEAEGSVQAWLPTAAGPGQSWIFGGAIGGSWTR